MKNQGQSLTGKVTPLALILLKRFEKGETAKQLAISTGIPVERILTRLSAATTHLQTANNTIQ